MKKTLTLLFALVAFAAFAGHGPSAGKPTFEPIDSSKINLDAQMGEPFEMGNIQPAPPGMQELMMERAAAKLKATPNLPGTTVDDLVGGYAWVYRQYTGGFTTQPDTISNNFTFKRDTVDIINLLGINKIDDSNIRITGMFSFPVQAEIDASGNYATFTIDDTQIVYYHSTYGACCVKGVWYFEGNDTYNAGWYYGDVMGFIVEGGIIMDEEVNFFLSILSGTNAGKRLGWIYEPGSYMLPDTDYNGLMTYNYTSSAATNAGLTPTYDWPVSISEDENYVVTVNNFGGVATNPVTINLEEGRTWTAESTVLYSNANGSFMLYGLESGSNTSIDLTGAGTEKVLTFNSDWTGWDKETGRWLGRRSNTTITLISDDEFVYPGEQLPEPGFFLVGTFNDWNQTAAGGRLAFDESLKLEGVELEAGAEFKVIAFDDNGTVWFGGQDDNNVGYFLLNNNLMGEGIYTIEGDAGANFRVEESGTYNIELAVERGFSGDVIMTVTKADPSAIGTVGVDKTDNAYYNLIRKLRHPSRSKKLRDYLD
jgi:hypothetical protein